MDDLAAGLAFPGIVRNDTSVFDAAARHGLTVLSFEVLLPDASFAVFEQTLKDETAGPTIPMDSQMGTASAIVASHAGFGSPRGKRALSNPPRHPST
jgi:hypothetical protein